jgi:ABC-type oligopeptide transport system substrate-binding subunit/class 3 adenylate cyclase
MTERERLEQAIAALEAQRESLGDETVDAALGPLHRQLAALDPAGEISRQALMGERKLVTVMFADLSGFTTLLEELDPETVRELVNACFDCFVPIITKFGGTIEKFIGDEVMAIFGAPVAHEDDPERAIRTALELMEELAVFNKSHNVDVEIHIGISTGLVIAGLIGTEREQQYGVMGETVNLAKRLEEAAPEGCILISDDTYRLVRGLFSVVPQPPIQVKGITKPVVAYLVEKIKPRGVRVDIRGVEGIETQMVGREAELLTLQNIFYDAIEGAETHLVTIVGEAGIGKSRLLFEFENWIGLLPPKIWYFKGWASAGMEAEPYGVIKRIFDAKFDILKSDSNTAVRDKIRKGLAVALTSEQADQVGRLLGFDLPISLSLKNALESELFREKAIEYLVEYLQAVSYEPTVIFLDDVHLADDSSLDLVDSLTEALPDARLMIVCLARPPLFENRPGWGEGRKAHSILEIRALSRMKSRALVDEILQKVDYVPHQLRSLIVEGAEGNPFFMEELVKMLIDDGVIQDGETKWQVNLDGLEQIRIPPTLAGVIQARLDSLPVEERAVLQRASVVGKLFWDMAVAELMAEKGDKIEKERLMSVLDSVRARELVFRREYSTFAETEEYIFKHTLLRDVTYETVLLKLRKVYHKQVAAWLETAAGDRLGEYLGLIASHYELAGDQAKAVDYLLRTGDRARIAYAHHEAIDAYQRALAIQQEQEDLSGAARTLMRLGLVHHTAFDFKKSRRAYQEGFTLWQKAGDIALESTASPPQAQSVRLIRGVPYSLDLTMTDHTDSSVAIFQLFSGLVESGTAMEVLPDVAKSWEISDGGRKYTFTLRDDVNWSDGTPVTSSDFMFAWVRTLDPANQSPTANLLYDIKGAREFHTGQAKTAQDLGIHTPDPHTLVVELEGPTGYFLSLLACSATFPIPKHQVEALGEKWTEPKHFVSNGPFRLKDWKRGKFMVLDRNQEYHGRFRGNLQSLEFVFNIDKDSVLDGYQNAELDILSLENLNPEEWDLARRRYAEDYVASPEAITHYVGFDVTTPPFDDPRVRQAFALATDKVYLANVILRGYMFPATGGFTPPGVPGHLPEIALGYDPDQARALLAAAGYPQGKGFPAVKALARSRVRTQSEFLEGQWLENLGVEIHWELLPWREYLEYLDENRVHIFQFGWMADYPDPDSFLRTGNVQQRTLWQDKDFDDLVERARRVLEQYERLKRYEEAERIMAREVPVIPLTYSRSHFLVKPWVRKFPASSINQWLWKDVYVEDH